MTVHKVKSWVPFFQAFKRGEKKHDMRDLRDREYKVGDIMILQEFDQIKGEYTGDEMVREITYITDKNTPCAFSSHALDRDYCILSLDDVEVDGTFISDEENS